MCFQIGNGAPTFEDAAIRPIRPCSSPSRLGIMDQLGRSPLRVPSVGKYAPQKKESIQDATMRLSTCPIGHRPTWHPPQVQDAKQRPSNRRRCIDATLQKQSKMQHGDSRPAREAMVPASSSPRCKAATLQPSTMHRCDPAPVQAGSGSMDQMGRSPLRVP